MRCLSLCAVTRVHCKWAGRSRPRGQRCGFGTALTLFRAVPILALAGFVTGLGVVVYNVNQVSLRQAITPERLQGRMNATMRWFVWGTIPLGGLLGGALGTAIGLRQTIILASIAEGFVFLPVLLSAVRTIRTMPRAET